MKNIGVFLSAADVPEKYIGPAKEFARLLAKNKFNLVWGGSDKGLMKIVADEVQQHDGKLISVTMPLVQKSVRQDSDEIIYAKDLSESKKIMAEKADAIVVLGGGWAPSSNDLIGFNASFAADRFLTGLELFRKGKSKLILIGGGAAEIEDGKPGDSIHMADWMKSFSLDGAEAIALPACHNTREEALRVKEVIEKRGGGKILLVTSAWHMRRSAAVFKGVGLDIFPVPCDFEMSSLAESASKKPNLVPGLEQLVFLNLYLHEWVGWHFYKMKGWIH